MASLSAKSKSDDTVSADPNAVGELQLIKTTLIDVPTGRRKIDPSWVEVLAADFAERGQVAPIEVVVVGERFRLVHGAHRKAAAEVALNGEVKALVKHAGAYATEAELKLREIAENFLRRELSVLDRARDVATWRGVFEAAKGAVKPGRKNSGTRATNSTEPLDPDLADAVLDELAGRFADSFTEAAQQALGLSRDQVFRYLKIASITGEAQDIIALHTLADNQSELLQLARVDAAHQAPAARLIVHENVVGVAAALQELGFRTAVQPKAPWERLGQSFSRLKEREQHKFFDLNRAAIERWLAQVK